MENLIDGIKFKTNILQYTEQYLPYEIRECTREENMREKSFSRTTERDIMMQIYEDLQAETL